MSRYRDTQLQVTENVCLCEIQITICHDIYQCFKIEGIFYHVYCEQFVIRLYTGSNKNTEYLMQSTSVLASQG